MIGRQPSTGGAYSHQAPVSVYSVLQRAMLESNMPDMPLARIEQIKLRATFLNNMGVPLFVTGAVLPVLNAFLDVGPPFGLPQWLATVCCAVSGYGLHLLATLVLEDLSR